MQLPFDRILITGAGGFVGRHLVPLLESRLRDNGRIFLCVQTSSARSDHEEIVLDLADPSAVAATVETVRPDLVIHLAAQSSVGRSLEGAGDTWATNVGGSIALARALSATVPRCTVFFVSSAEVYGATFNDGVATEGSPLRPLSPYARSKAAAEAMLADVLPADARLIVARPSNHSGPGQDDRFVIPAFARQIVAAENGADSLIKVGNLDSRRDFLDVRDVIRAYLALLLRSPELPARSVFNIASGDTVAISDILTQLRAMSAVATWVEQDPARMRPNEIPVAAIDSDALRAATGWSRKFDLATMLGDLLAAQRVHR